MALALRLRRRAYVHAHWNSVFWWFGGAALAGAMHHGLIVQWPGLARVSWAHQRCRRGRRLVPARGHGRGGARPSESPRVLAAPVGRSLGIHRGGRRRKCGNRGHVGVREPDDGVCARAVAVGRLPQPSSRAGHAARNRGERLGGNGDARERGDPKAGGARSYVALSSLRSQASCCSTSPPAARRGGKPTPGQPSTVR